MDLLSVLRKLQRLPRRHPLLTVILLTSIVLLVWNTAWSSPDQPKQQQQQNNVPENGFLEGWKPALQNLQHQARSPGNASLLSLCGCQRSSPWPPNSVENPNLLSSCSDEGTFRYPRQNVISFFLHLHNGSHAQETLVQQRILENLKNMRSYYPPGYTVRFYTDEEPHGGYCALLCQNPDLFWCDVRKTPSLGDVSNMFFKSWRFLPLGDDTVEIFHVRSLNAVVGAREVTVVKDWQGLKNPKAFYLMRDFRNLHNMAMPPSLWGGNNKLVENVTELRDIIVKESDVGRSQGFQKVDQHLLTIVVHKKRAKKEVVSYDSYHCDWWGPVENMTRPFPVRRANRTDFVGREVDRKDLPPVSECPVGCRPSYGKNWTYC